MFLIILKACKLQGKIISFIETASLISAKIFRNVSRNPGGDRGVERCSLCQWTGDDFEWNHCSWIPELPNLYRVLFCSYPALLGIPIQDIRGSQCWV